MESHKSFKLKFLHTSARVTVITHKSPVNKKASGNGTYYSAFIVFNKAYMQRGYNYYTIEDIMSPDIDKACEMAAFQFKEFYSVLDWRIREIGTFNFFISRILIKSLQIKLVDDFKATFVYWSHYYAISENIEGHKYNRTQFVQRSTLATLPVLMLINRDFALLFHSKGFNFKLLTRLMAKRNKVKPSQLRIFNTNEILSIVPEIETVDSHISKHRTEFNIAMILHKIKG